MYKVDKVILYLWVKQRFLGTSPYRLHSEKNFLDTTFVMTRSRYMNSPVLLSEVGAAKEKLDKILAL